MEIIAFGPDDRERVDDSVAVVNAVRAADTPWEPRLTPHEAEADLRYGWDGEPATPYLGCVGGVPVAVGSISTSEYDNRHLAVLGLDVHPDRRRRGHGTELLEALTDEARSRNRTLLGLNGWETKPSRKFAKRRGFVRKSAAINRRQVLADVDWSTVEKLHAESLEAAAEYEFIHRTGPTPDDELDAVAALTAAINDAPTDDLDIEDEVFPPERIRAYESVWVKRGDRMHRVLARHRETGELAGHSVVVVNGERPRLADQHDTSVVKTHRGHRLGVALKTEMNVWLRDIEPQIEWIGTWNAESNGHMIGVNELLGYRVMGREFNYQKSI